MLTQLNARPLRAVKKRIPYPPPAVAGMLTCARKLITNKKKHPVGFKGHSSYFTGPWYHSSLPLRLRNAPSAWECGQDYVISNMAPTSGKTGLHRLSMN
jgi:hypothetical protein